MATGKLWKLVSLNVNCAQHGITKRLADGSKRRFEILNHFVFIRIFINTKF